MPNMASETNSRYEATDRNTMAEVLKQITDEMRGENYYYHEVMKEVDRLNRELIDMKETVLKTNVRVHMLESELASLVNPDLAESLRSVQKSCKDCTLAMKLEELEQLHD